MGDLPPADVRAPLWADLFAALVVGLAGGAATLPLGFAALQAGRSWEVLSLAGTTLAFAAAWCGFLSFLRRRVARRLPLFLLGLPSFLVGVLAANGIVSTVQGEGFMGMAALRGSLRFLAELPGMAAVVAGVCALLFAVHVEVLRRRLRLRVAIPIVVAAGLIGGLGLWQADLIEVAWGVPLFGLAQACKLLGMRLGERVVASTAPDRAPDARA